MARSSTTFGKNNQPKKKTGKKKSERTKILEAMARAGETEEGFYDLLITRALNPEDSFTFKELLTRMSPVPKAVAPMVEFDFPKKAAPHIQAASVVDAISNGKIPPDIGAMIIASIQSMIKIQEVTDIDERLKAMESQIESPE